MDSLIIEAEKALERCIELANKGKMFAGGLTRDVIEGDLIDIQNTLKKLKEFNNG